MRGLKNMNSHQQRKLRKKQKHSRQVLGKIITDEDARIRWSFLNIVKKLLNLNEGVTRWYEFTTKLTISMDEFDGI
jgi:methionyl-tRNA formyltransferase